MQRPIEPTREQDHRWLIAAGGTFLLLYAAWLLWGRQVAWERYLIGNLTMTFSSLVVLWLASIARQKVGLSILLSRQPVAGGQIARLRKAWTWLVLGMGFWALTDLVRMFAQANQESFAIRNPALNLIYLAGSIFTWVGLAVYPRQPRQPLGRWVVLFDSTLVTAAALTLVWMMAIQPVPSFGSTLSGGWLAALYPLVDLGSLLLLLNLFLLSNPDHLPAPFGWVALGMFCYTFSDLIFASRVVSAGYQSGSFSDLGWVLGDGFLALGALAQLRSQGETTQHMPFFLRRMRARVQSLLPLIAAMVLGGYTLIQWMWYGQLSLLGLWVTLVLGLGLIARQGFLAGEIEMQQYAHLVNSVAEPAFVCDEHGYLRLVNPALLAATGYTSAQELLGAPLQQLIHPAEETFTRVQQGLGGGWSGELFLRQQGGGLVPISLALRPLVTGRGGHLALAGTAHDLSEQKRQQAALQAAYEQIAADRAELERLNARLEQRVAEKTADLTQALQQLEQQNQALQQLDRLKSDFVSLVSHELRAPLTNINGGIELLLSNPKWQSRAQKIPEHARQNLELVQSEILRLTRFVETILDLSALEAGRVPLYPAPVALHVVAEGLDRQLQRSEEGRRVRWQIPADLPPLLADEQALNSVLFHLLDNSFKYAAQGAVTVLARAANGQVEVQVLDEGPGIPPEAMPLIFDRFYRAQASDSQATYGHGLGLYIVQHLLEAMDGRIEASNRPEGGACFTFWLPVVENQDAS